MWTPADIPNIVDWWRVDDGVLVAGAVENWVGYLNGIVLTQANGALQPMLTADQINGQPALVFDGTDEYLQGAFTEIEQPNTIIIVCSEPTDTGAARVMYDGREITKRHTLFENGATSTYRLLGTPGVSQNTNQAIGVAGTFRIWSTIFRGATSVFRVNGTTKTIAGALGASGLTGLTLGSKQNGTQSADTKITDVLVVNGAMTVTQFEITKTYLNVLRRGIY